MVKRQEEKRRKRFANRVWACRFLLEERQAWSGERQPCRSSRGSGSTMPAWHPLPRQ
jgi:hypothetical protein